MATLTDLLTSKIPPHDLGLERALLGAALLDVASAERLATRLRPGDFYKEAHRQLFAIITRLLESGQGLDVRLVAATCRQAELGHPEILSELATLVEEAATTGLLDEYARGVLERSAQRDTIRLATEAIGRAYNGEGPAATIATELGEALQQLAMRTEPQAPPAETDVALGLAAERVVAKLERGEHPDFLPTPFPWLTEELGGGVLAGEMIDLGGRPGVAKSALALEWATLAAQKGFPTLVISREMSIEALARRALAQKGQVLARHLRSGHVDADELRRLRAIVPRLHAMPVRFDDGSATLGQIQRKVARAVQTGIRFLIVDYLQLVRGPKGTDRRLEVEAVSAGLKGLALRYNLVVLALSSLTPPPPGKGNKRPRPDMDSLRESRALEHDADIVLLLHRPSPDSADRELIIAKARDGGTGRCTLYFEGAYLRFQESVDAVPASPPLNPDDPQNEVPF